MTKWRGKGWVDDAYYYFDLNAGPGLTHDYAGSPAIFLQEASKYPSMKVHATLIEVRKDNTEALAKVLAPYHSSTRIFDIRHGDHNDVLPEYFVGQRKKRLGLVYTDPTGSIPPFDLLAEMSKVSCYAKTDFLISCAATTIKRARGCSVCHQNKHLVYFLGAIDKQYWNVREPLGRHQWTLLIGSNWNAYPTFKHLGFYSASSEKGKAILERLNYSSKELQNGKDGC